MKPKITQALEYLLDKLKSKEDARVMRSQIPRAKTSQKFNESFVFCRDVNRPAFDTHYLSQCILSCSLLSLLY